MRKYYRNNRINLIMPVLGSYYNRPASPPLLSMFIATLLGACAVIVGITTIVEGLEGADSADKQRAPKKLTNKSRDPVRIGMGFALWLVGCSVIASLWYRLGRAKVEIENSYEQINLDNCEISALREQIQSQNKQISLASAEISSLREQIQSTCHNPPPLPHLPEEVNILNNESPPLHSSIETTNLESLAKDGPGPIINLDQTSCNPVQRRRSNKTFHTASM